MAPSLHATLSADHATRVRAVLGAVREGLRERWGRDVLLSASSSAKQGGRMTAETPHGESKGWGRGRGDRDRALLGRVARRATPGSCSCPPTRFGDRNDGAQETDMR